MCNEVSFNSKLKNKLNFNNKLNNIDINKLTNKEKIKLFMKCTTLINFLKKEIK